MPDNSGALTEASLPEEAEIDEIMPSEQLRRENPDLITSNASLEWFIYSTHISLRHRFIYIETPKAACSTMKRALQRLETGAVNWRRWSYLHDRKCSPLLTPLQVPSFLQLRRDEQIRKFCVIRSPHTRLLSAYLDKICRYQPQRKMITEILGHNSRGEDEEISFRDFVEAVASQRPEEMDPHWKPQALLLNASSFTYDLFLRMENLDSDIKLLGDLLGCSLAPFYSPIKRGRTNADSGVSQYYSDPALFRRVSAIYAEDLDLAARVAADQ